MKTLDVFMAILCVIGLSILLPYSFFKPDFEIKKRDVLQAVLICQEKGASKTILEVDNKNGELKYKCE
jgi:hypothetical protein